MANAVFQLAFASGAKVIFPRRPNAKAVGCIIDFSGWAKLTEPKANGASLRIVVNKRHLVKNEFWAPGGGVRPALPLEGCYGATIYHNPATP